MHLVVLASAVHDSNADFEVCRFVLTWISCCFSAYVVKFGEQLKQRGTCSMHCILCPEWNVVALCDDGLTWIVVCIVGINAFSDSQPLAFSNSHDS